MATHDYVIDNSTGSNVRSDLNNVLQAILTNNSSSSAPSTTAAYMWWADTTNGVLKIRNSANNAWIELLQLDGTLTLEDGSASTPALAFRDDLNTGIFSSAADNFDISTGGTVRLNVNGSITKISDVLDVTTVRRQVQNSNLLIAGGNATNDGANINLYGSAHSSQANNIEFRASGTNTMKLDSSGRLLIGTTTEGNISADDLTVAGSGDTGITVRSGTSNSGNLFFSDGTSGGDEYRGYLQYQHATNKLAIGTNATTAITIDSSGNVGIGTTDPNGESINGSQNLVIMDTSSDGGMNIKTGTSGNAQIHFSDTSGNGQGRLIYAHANDSMQMWTAGSERMRIDSSGRLLLGTTTEGNSDGDEFTIANTSNANMGMTIRSGTGAIGNIFFSDGTSGDSEYRGMIQYGHNNDSMRFATSANERMRITSNGQIMHGCTDVTDSGSSVANNFAFSSDGNPTVVRSHSNMIYGATSNSADRHAMQLVQHRYNRYTMLSVHTNTGITGPHFLFYQGTNAVGSIHTGDSSTSFNTSSDYRLKENETVISDGITRLKTLIPRRFNWKIDETNTPVDGFFAHEVTAVPEAITGTKDQVATADDVSNELKEGDPIYQSIDQSKLVPLLVAAVKELIGKVEALEAA